MRSHPRADDADWAYLIRGDCRRPGDAAARGLARTRLQHGRGSEGHHLGSGAAQRLPAHSTGMDCIERLEECGKQTSQSIPRLQVILRHPLISFDILKRCRFDWEEDDEPMITP